MEYQRISAERPITLTRAVVPIIKFREFYTKFNVDISFNQSSGYISARAMKNYLDQWPSLGKMVILVKWFLKHHLLDDPAVGGMGGFTVFCMMLSFFQVRLCLLFLSLFPFNTLNYFSKTKNFSFVLDASLDSKWHFITK